MVEEQHIVEQEHDKSLVQEEQEEHAGVVEVCSKDMVRHWNWRI